MRPDNKTMVDAMPHQSRMLQLLIENARDYAILMLDVEGLVTLWNKGAETLPGLARG